MTSSPLENKTLFEDLLMKRHVLFILIAIGLAAYGNVLNGVFFFDDESLILENQYVKNFKVKEIYTSSITEGAGVVGNFYRGRVRDR